MSGRVAVFGGTFDPVHYGHIEAVDLILQYLSVDKVLLVPAGQQPFKKKSTTVEHRLELLELALQNKSNVEVSMVEVNRSGKSYTIDSLDILAVDNVDPILVVGTDKLKELPRWKQAERLFSTYTIAVLPRLGYCVDELIVNRLREDFLADIIMVESKPPMEVSSTLIRGLLARGKRAETYIPVNVYKYIQKNGLYLSECVSEVG